MAEKIIFYGRSNGQLKFSYGPKTFYADWGGAFTALEIANLIAKLPRVNIGSRTPMKIYKIGSAVEKVNLQLWLERLELGLAFLDLEALMINAKKVNPLWVDNILPSKMIKFSSKSPMPSKLVCDALCKMRLNYWGVVKELTVAISEFGSKVTSGKQTASVFFTI
jgi:hypothetical protein